MSYRLHPASLGNVTSGKFSATKHEGRSFSALGEAIAWAARGWRRSDAVVLIEEGSPAQQMGFRTAEDAARSVA
ncbi:MAG TPA: hypothetical protein PL193_13010 [Xanthobacteraceae bacterium]|nr:hypothetical protein [Xanthobacteraceae bacterium]